MKDIEIPDELKRVVEFHGHICPGLAIGYRAAKAAAAALGISRDQDEELVTVVENDACGIDAFQVLLGCSVGKGNLIFRDHGKHAYTVFRRDNGESVRIVLKGQPGKNSPEENALRAKVFGGAATAEERAEFDNQKNQRIQELLTTGVKDLFDFKKPSFQLPEKAHIFNSIACESCGEVTMEPRLRLVDGRKLCLDCSHPYHRGW